MKRLKRESKEAGVDAVSDELIDNFTIAGAPEACIKRIEILERKGVKQVAIIPYPLPGKDRQYTIESFARNVVSYFKD